MYTQQNDTKFNPVSLLLQKILRETKPIENTKSTNLRGYLSVLSFASARSKFKSVDLVYIYTRYYLCFTSFYC